VYAGNRKGGFVRAGIAREAWKLGDINVTI
jgi:hypothetical protein